MRRWWLVSSAAFCDGGGVVSGAGVQMRLVDR